MNAGGIPEEKESVVFAAIKISAQDVAHNLLFRKKMPHVVVIRQGLKIERVKEIVAEYDLNSN